jgi:hypothetical protein
MTATAVRRWSPAQAGYRPTTQVVTTTRPDTPEASGLVRHYVSTRHGIVARTWVGPDLVEVTIRRRGQVRGTYLGHVLAVTGGWQAHAPNGTPTGAVHADYLDAEAPMLLARTGHTARGTYRWPHVLVYDLNRDLTRS